VAIRSVDRRSVYPAGNAVRRALLTLRGEGLRSFWFKLVGEMGYRRLLLLDQPLVHGVPQFSPTRPVVVAQLTVDEIDDYLAFRPDTARAAVIDRLGAGQMCFVARFDRRIVAADWIATQPIRLSYLDCVLDLAPGDVCIYDKFILPAYRGHGISNALRTHHLRQLQRAGHRRVVVAVLPENASSLRDILKGGYRPCGILGRIKVGRWQRHFRKALPKV
jgi:GNAT superfamily N-acetyltransferase